jgi:hypothetical protein
MATDPYPVIRYRRTEDHPSTSTPSGASVAERIAHIGERLPPIRRGEWMFYPIPWPLTEVSHHDPKAHISAACSCRQVTLTHQLIFADLRTGRRTRVVAA